jgi:hypothetical protein
MALRTKKVCISSHLVIRAVESTKNLFYYSDGLPTYEEALNLPPSYQTRNDTQPVTVAVTSV